MRTPGGGPTGSHPLLRPRPEAVALLQRHGYTAGQASDYIREVPVSPDSRTESPEPLFTITGYEPLIRLLESAGGIHCSEVVRVHLSADEAGRYFMAFAPENRALQLHDVIDSFPEAYRRRFRKPLESESAASKTELIPVSQFSQSVLYDMFVSEPLNAASRAITPKFMKENTVREIVKGADGILEATCPPSPNVGDLLGRFPTATPKSLAKILDILRRLESMYREPESQGTIPSGPTSSARYIDWERLLADTEPFMYRSTYMCRALQKVQLLFEEENYHRKSLLLVSDGKARDGDPVPLAHAIITSGGTVFACLLTTAHLAEPRRLRDPEDDEIRNSGDAVRAMFSMASTISCSSDTVQFLRRRGWRIPGSGRYKLFTQANNPSIVDEFTSASWEFGNSADTLLDVFGQVSLDNYIHDTNVNARATRQVRPICWAHATASVFHLASSRVVGRRVNFMSVRDDLLRGFGNDGQSVGDVLGRTCQRYRLRYCKIDEAGARDAIHARRPVIATFWLDGARWASFCGFYKSNPTGILTSRDIPVPSPLEVARAEAAGEEPGGHAVVLVRCTENTLTFMNSWGHVATGCIGHSTVTGLVDCEASMLHVLVHADARMGVYISCGICSDVRLVNRVELLIYAE